MARRYPTGRAKQEEEESDGDAWDDEKEQWARDVEMQWMYGDREDYQEEGEEEEMFQWARDVDDKEEWESVGFNKAKKMWIKAAKETDPERKHKAEILQATILGIFPTLEANLREEAQRYLEQEDEQQEARGQPTDDKLHQNIISANQRWLASKKKTEQAADTLREIQLERDNQQEVLNEFALREAMHKEQCDALEGELAKRSTVTLVEQREINLRQVFGKDQGQSLTPESMAAITETVARVKGIEEEAEERAAEEEKKRRRGSRSRTPPKGEERGIEAKPGDDKAGGTPAKAAEEGDIKARGRSPTQKTIDSGQITDQNKKLVQEAHKITAAKVEENLKEAKQRKAEEVKKKAQKAAEARVVLAAVEASSARLAAEMQVEAEDL